MLFKQLSKSVGAFAIRIELWRSVLGIPAPDKPAKPAAWSGQAVAGFINFCPKRLFYFSVRLPKLYFFFLSMDTLMPTNTVR
jgi:hypothetical protein